MSLPCVHGLAPALVLLAAAASVLASGPALSADASAFVTASSVHSEPYPPGDALDGDRQTRWASRGFTGPSEWLQIDLGSPVAIPSLVIHWERAYAVEYQIQVSTDGQGWQTVHHQQQGQGGREAIRDLAAHGRYLRLLCLKPGQYGLVSVWEIEFPDGEAARAVAEAKRRAAEARARTLAKVVETIKRLMFSRVPSDMANMS